MKTCLNGYGYGIFKSSVKAKVIDDAKKELVVTPFIAPDFQIEPPRAFKLYQESANVLYLPRYYGLKVYGPPHDHKIQEGKDIKIRFTGKLRDAQMEPCNAFLNACKSHAYGGGGILNLPCGFGKTVIGLHLIAELGKKTLVVVHKDFLLQQWHERISTFLPGAKVGLIKASTNDVEDKDIVMASLQSISMKDYGDNAIFKEFGFVIVDECHHTSAEVFSRALRKTSFKYTLGLSATLQRKDGLSKVFKWFLGDVLFKAKNQPDTDRPVKVVIKRYFDANDAYSQEYYLMGNKLNVSRMINQICDYEPRSVFIINIIDEVLRAEPDRRILILTDRRDHVANMSQKLSQKGLQVGIYQGGLKSEILKSNEQKQVIIGTFQFVSEGFDVPGLDTLILASPKSDVIQSVGRILRDKPEDRKYQPMVIDIIDDFSIFERQGDKRKRYYQKQKYEIEGDNARFSSKMWNIESEFQGRCIIQSENDCQ
jgi:superfamily II DNA or RNA helicase